MLNRFIGILFICFACQGSLLANPDAQKITQLITDLKTEVEKNPELDNSRVDAFKTVLDKYLDWDYIVNRALRSVKVHLRKSNPNAEENKNHYKNFIVQFKENFKKAMIKTYADANYMKNLIDAVFLYGECTVDGNVVHIPFNVKDRKIMSKWSLNSKNSKVFDLEIEDIQIFRAITDEISSIFNNNGGDTDFKKGIDKLQEEFVHKAG